MIPRHHYTNDLNREPTASLTASPNRYSIPRGEAIGEVLLIALGNEGGDRDAHHGRCGPDDVKSAFG